MREHDLSIWRFLIRSRFFSLWSSHPALVHACVWVLLRRTVAGVGPGGGGGGGGGQAELDEEPDAATATQEDALLPARTALIRPQTAGKRPPRQTKARTRMSAARKRGWGWGVGGPRLRELLRRLWPSRKCHPPYAWLL